MLSPRRMLRNSRDSRRSTTVPRVLLLPHKPNLGDKLQRLAQVSPRHIFVVELLVDQILRRLDNCV